MTVYEYYKKLLNISFYLSYILYGLILIGFYNIAPEYLNTLNLFMKIFISSFLIIYFNPFSNHEFNKFDKKVIFTGGIFLLMTTTVADFIHPYMNKELNRIQNIKILNK